MSRRKTKPSSILLDLIDRLKSEKNHLRMFLKGFEPNNSQEKIDRRIQILDHKIQTIIDDMTIYPFSD